MCVYYELFILQHFDMCTQCLIFCLKRQSNLQVHECTWILYWDHFDLNFNIILDHYVTKSCKVDIKYREWQEIQKNVFLVSGWKACFHTLKCLLTPRVSPIVCSSLQANSEESIRKELVALQEDKHNYETTVKESLKRSLEEKLEACRKLSDMEVSLLAYLQALYKDLSMESW